MKDVHTVQPCASKISNECASRARKKRRCARVWIAALLQNALQYPQGRGDACKDIEPARFQKASPEIMNSIGKTKPGTHDAPSRFPDNAKQFYRARVNADHEQETRHLKDEVAKQIQMRLNPFFKDASSELPGMLTVSCRAINLHAGRMPEPF